MIKDIPNFEDYKIDENGNIYSKRFNQPLKTSIDRYGYKKVTLFKNGKAHYFTVHRLVALSFIPNPEGFNTVNHKDENKLNNSVYNLEWCTPKYNANYGNRNKKLAACFSKPILQLSLNDEVIKKWDSISEAIKFYKNTAIGLCVKNRRSSAAGYKWKYLEG